MTNKNVPFVISNRGMSYELVVDEFSRIASVKMWGSVSGHEVGEVITAIYQNPSWAAGNTIFWDVIGITACLFEQEDYPELVMIHRKNEGLAPRIEVILVKRIMEKATSKVYATFMLKAKHKVCVCDSPGEAIALL